jgi:hypothetical protein
MSRASIPTHRKIFECKIIRSGKIPFPLGKKNNERDIERGKNFQTLIAQTEDISEIVVENLC